MIEGDDEWANCEQVEDVKDLDDKVWNSWDHENGKQTD